MAGQTAARPVTDFPQQGTDVHQFTLAPECRSATAEPTAHAQT